MYGEQKELKKRNYLAMLKVVASSKDKNFTYLPKGFMFLQL